ncbi:hypothetical protein H0H92_003764 [Tricholoma furcatifolium]|nr:hypothetical protein H0H92_003764 [Tricholoma furcatifolium]
MFGRILDLGLLSLVLANGVGANVVTSLEIVNKVIDPDLFPRPAVLANGSYPGPAIIGNKGDLFTINVTNSLTDPRMLRATSIHWHGIFQNGTNWDDGVAMVTQCPIVPGNSFLYNFSVHEQAGTYWYHSHYSTQYCDGLRGPMVIYDPDDPYLGSYDVDDAVINVEAGKRYRFRLIGLSCDAPFNFTIHNHQMTIIETDGEYTAPLVVDSLWVYAGQRYSVIVEANRPVGNYWVRADPLSPRGYPGFDNGRNSAILRYSGAPAVDPTTDGVSTMPLNEDDLQSIVTPQPPGEPLLGGADIVIPIIPTWHDDVEVFDINGAIYESPSVPVLLQILNGTYAATDLMPNGSVYTLKPNSSVELQIHGVSKGAPHSFWVVKNALSDTYNWVNPARRDTVPTGYDGNVTVIRFVTDNSGPWFLHCGLAVVFAEDPEGTAAHVKPIPREYPS